MSIYTPVPLDVNRKFNFYDKIFEVKAVVEIVNFTPVSNRDGSYYVDVATKPASYDRKPDTTVELTSRISFDRSFLEIFPNELLINTLWRVDSFFHLNSVPKTIPHTTIRIIPDKHD